jgi:hypothetical protein
VAAQPLAPGETLLSPAKVMNREYATPATGDWSALAAPPSRPLTPFAKRLRPNLPPAVPGPEAWLIDTATEIG